MSNISKNGIVTLTKGDTFQLPLFINSGTEFDPVAFDFQEGDQVLLRLMRANESFNDAVLKKTFVYGGENEDSYLDDKGNVVFKFSYYDTYWIKYGIYFYEAKVIYTRDNEEKIWTFSPRNKFYITE